MSFKTTSQTPDLKLYFLQGSRAIRIAWLLTELNLPYENLFFARTPAGKAPPEMSQQSRSAMGKSPALRDGSLLLTESGAITEYIIAKYDLTKKFFGGNDVTKREEIRSFIHAAEGTMMLHVIAIPFSRWFATPKSSDLEKIEKGVLAMVWKDLDWLETVLEDKAQGEEIKGRYLVGYELSAADTMMLFSVQLIFKRYCGGRTMGEWRNVKGWVERCEGRSAWKEAVKKTGHSLD